MFATHARECLLYYLTPVCAVTAAGVVEEFDFAHLGSNITRVRSGTASVLPRFRKAVEWKLFI